MEVCVENTFLQDPWHTNSKQQLHARHFLRSRQHDNISYIIKLAGTVYSGAVFSQFENGNYNITSTLNTMNKSNSKTLRDVLASLGVEAD